MGQYWLPVNLDKKQFIDPHMLGDGLKLWEQVANNGVGRALTILLADFHGRKGGGDLEDSPIVGLWAGDRVALVGDYADEGEYGYQDGKTVYERCREGEYTDISLAVCEVIEKELDGKFVGSGWRAFKENGVDS